MFINCDDAINANIVISNLVHHVTYLIFSYELKVLSVLLPIEIYLYDYLNIYTKTRVNILGNNIDVCCTQYLLLNQNKLQ